MKTYPSASEQDTSSDDDTVFMDSPYGVVGAEGGQRDRNLKYWRLVQQAAAHHPETKKYPEKGERIEAAVAVR